MNIEVIWTSFPISSQNCSILNCRPANAGFDCTHTFRCITLRVHSSLRAVGLTAAVSAELARHGVSANVVAGYCHDHVLVPSEQAEEALGHLQNLSRAAGSR